MFLSEIGTQKNVKCFKAGNGRIEMIYPDFKTHFNFLTFRKLKYPNVDLNSPIFKAKVNHVNFAKLNRVVQKL